MRTVVKLFVISLLSFLASCSGSDTTPPADPIVKVSFQDSNSAWVITGDGNLIEIISNGKTHRWEQFDGIARLVYFFDKENGWMVDRSGGVWSFSKERKWQKIGEIEDGLDKIHTSRMIFIDSLHGWIVTSFSLLKTNDGGKNWRNILNIKNDSSFSPVDFYPNDIQSGWLIANPGSIAYTKNDGVDWQVRKFAGNSDVWSISCIKTKLCFVGTGQAGLYKFHPNEGLDLKPLQKKSDHIVIKSVVFTPNEVMWVSGFEPTRDTDKQPKGLLMKSNDLGETWIPVNVDKQSIEYKRVYFFDNDTGWLVDRSSIYNTVDGGHFWNKVAAFAN